VAAAGSGNALIVTLLIPPVAIVLGALVLDERLGPNALAGFGLLALGLARDERTVQPVGRERAESLRLPVRPAHGETGLIARCPPPPRRCRARRARRGALPSEWGSVSGRAGARLGHELGHGGEEGIEPLPR
jgi:hypothetical protein